MPYKRPQPHLLRLFLVKKRQILTGLILVLLQSCAITNLEDWPAELPDVQLFVEAYQQDSVNQGFQQQEVYLYWVKAFYQGNIAYPTGWSDVEQVILAETGVSVDQDFSEQLFQLGISIGSEWAKENPIRKIDNRMLSMWASILQISLTENLHRETVSLVQSDIAALFEGTLSKEELTDARYEELLGLELFGGF